MVEALAAVVSTVTYITLKCTRTHGNSSRYRCSLTLCYKIEPNLKRHLNLGKWTDHNEPIFHLVESLSVIGAMCFLLNCSQSCMYGKILRSTFHCSLDWVNSQLAHSVTIFCMWQFCFILYRYKIFKWIFSQSVPLLHLHVKILFAIVCLSYTVEFSVSSSWILLGLNYSDIKDLPPRQFCS